VKPSIIILWQYICVFFQSLFGFGMFVNHLVQFVMWCYRLVFRNHQKPLLLGLDNDVASAIHFISEVKLDTAISYCNILCVIFVRVTDLGFFYAKHFCVAFSDCYILSWYLFCTVFAALIYDTTKWCCTVLQGVFASSCVLQFCFLYCRTFCFFFPD